MSSKLSVKLKPKDLRPKSSDRKNKKDEPRPNTTTPSQEAEDRLGSSRHVIWSEEIEKLQIKQDELKKVHLPHPPPEDKKTVTKKVTVKKIKKNNENEARVDTPPAIIEQRPVSTDDYSGYAGPRYDEKGDVIPYSILGRYENYYKEAVKRGDLLESLPTPQQSERVDTPTVKYEKKKNAIKLNQDEHSALKNWNLKMNDRKRQQTHISKILNKPLEELAMNQADNFRAIQEMRYLIDRSIPKIGYGKGFRDGSEFWNQQRLLGDDLHGIHMTLNQTQKGHPTPIEHVGLPQLVKAEKGCEWHGKTNVHFRYPWHRSEFLNHQLQQLQPYIDELSPWKPDFDYLQVIGSNKPYEKSDDSTSDENGLSDNSYEGSGQFYEDSKENQEPIKEIKPSEFIFGPSLLIDGQLAQWTGDGTSHSNEIAFESRVTFEAFTEERVTSYLHIVNNGTTTIYYDWKKMTKDDPFDLNKKPIQRFYFNNAPGVILPGETMKFPFVFKSPNPGVFTEQWNLETRPIVCGGAALLVTLRGFGIFQDKFKEQREKLERELLERQAKEICSRLLYELVNNIRTRERSPSPIDAYVTEEELFIRNNLGFQYEHDKISQLKELYSQLFPEEERAENVWSLSIEDLQESIMKLDDDDERKDSMLQQMNDILGKLTYSKPKPVLQQMQYAGYQIFLEAIDRIVGESLLLRQTMGLPVKNQNDLE
ncbi:hypothetical protein Btru_055327, partial [Bulinus truncatus]